MVHCDDELVKLLTELIYFLVWVLDSVMLLMTSLFNVFNVFLLLLLHGVDDLSDCLPNQIKCYVIKFILNFCLLYLVESVVVLSR